jgi:hypothetical protein
MPTFQSIPLHPELRQRLLENPNGGGGIRTPQALLSRHPQAIEDLLFHPNPNPDQNQNHHARNALVVDSLRMQVAQAMIGKTRTGRYRLQQQQQQCQKEELIPGATVCVQPPQEESSSWSTGCCALDALLTFPYHYNGCGDDDLISRSTTARIPPGIVLHLSGPFGKTPLALQLARSYAGSSSNHHRSPPRSGVRYCYSTAGHAGLPHHHNPTNANANANACPIAFQPIRTTTQLVRILAELQDEWSLEGYMGGPGMLIVDSVSNLEDDNHDPPDHHPPPQRWKRLARLYDVTIVVVSSSTAAQDEVPCGCCDIQLDCSQTHTTTTPSNNNPQSSSSSSSSSSVTVQMLKHPARICGGGDGGDDDTTTTVTLIHTPLGLTTPCSSSLE